MAHLWHAVDKGDKNIALRHVDGGTVEGDVVDRDEFGILIQPTGSNRRYLFPWTSVVNIVFEGNERERERAPRQATIL